MKSRRVLVAAIGAVALIAVLLGIVVTTVLFGRSGRVCGGVTVAGVKLGGLTRERAEYALRTWARDRLNSGITLTALDTRWNGTPWAFGARIEWKEAADRAYAVGRDGSIFHRAACVLGGGGSEKRITPRTLVDSSRAQASLAKVAKAVNRPHKDARMRVVAGRLVARQDEVGLKLDRNRAVKAIARGIESGQSVITLPVEVDEPDVTAKDAAGIDTLLARFTTTYNPGKVGRTHNLTIASGRVNGTVLKPGQVFSVNDCVGPRVAEAGFRMAQVFVRGKLEEGLGGGVCQVSSTLYNAVLLAGLKVIERHPHSRTVPYVRAGRDATVAYGLRDFRFQNSNSGPIAIIATAGGAHLTVDIYGSAKERKSIQIYTSGAKYTAVGRTTVSDGSLKPGQKKIVDKGARGVSVTVYRKVLQPDGTSLTQIVSRDRYAAQSAVVAVGPQAAASNAAASLVSGKSAARNVALP